MEIRFLELAPDYCTFRIPLSHKDFMEQIISLSMRFSFDHSTVRFDIQAKDFRLEAVEEERYWITYACFISDPRYRECAGQLSSEYLSYIRAKLSMEDAELANFMTGSYPVQEEIFAASTEEQLQEFKERISQTYCPETWNWLSDVPSPPSFGIALEDAASCKTWLENGHEAYVKLQLARLLDEKSDHPFFKQNFTYVYVGNSFCPLPLLGTAEKRTTLITVIKKCLLTDLHPVLVLPPLSEEWIHNVQEFLKEVQCSQLEIMVNDNGIKEWLYSQQRAGLFSSFSISEGPLLCKRKRDPRMKYLSTSRYGHSQAASGLVTHVPVASGLAASDLAASDPIPPGLTASDPIPSGLAGNTWYLPWYQMNTGTFCPLHALVTKGDRGKAERIQSCSCFCQNHYLIYPSHLQMMGRYNSLFGADLDSIAVGNPEKAGKIRIVWNMGGGES